MQPTPRVSRRAEGMEQWWSICLTCTTPCVTPPPQDTPFLSFWATFGLSFLKVVKMQSNRLAQNRADSTSSVKVSPSQV